MSGFGLGRLQREGHAQRLLAVGRHELDARAAAGVVVPAALAELIEQALAPSCAAPDLGRRVVRLREHLDERGLGLVEDHGDQPEAEAAAQPGKLAPALVHRAFFVPHAFYREVDVGAEPQPFNPLQQQGEVERFFHLYDQRLLLIPPQSHQIAGPHLAFDVIALLLKKTLQRSIQLRFMLNRHNCHSCALFLRNMNFLGF
ncbi:hypothetical protein D3C73_727440 [compost metagenome]